MTNLALREHVTSIAFSISLSKNQIETLVMLHRFENKNHFFDRFGRHSNNSYITTSGALIRRGLMRDHHPDVPYVPCELCDKEFCFDHKLTRAGVLVARLLMEAGIYQEVLDRYGIEPRSDAA